jgi:hypothetical protein
MVGTLLNNGGIKNCKVGCQGMRDVWVGGGRGIDCYWQPLQQQQHRTCHVQSLQSVTTSMVGTLLNNAGNKNCKV